jgi:hypothetical protein
MYLLVWFVSFAHAYNVTFCVTIDPEYNVDSLAGGDIWTTDDDQPARGFAFAVSIGYPGTIVASGNLNASGGNAGCTGTISLSGSGYVFAVFPYGSIGSNDFIHEDGTAELFVLDPITSGGTIPLGVDYNGDEALPQLAIFSYAILQHDGGNSGETFAIEFTAGGNQSGKDLSQLGEEENDKYVIAHELGHQVSMSRSDGIPSSAGANSDNCDGAGYLKKKYQSRAIAEGLAMWYALITWNTKNSGVCEFVVVHDPADFDLSGTAEWTIGESFDCAGDPEGGSLTDSMDWLGDMVVSHGALNCTGTITDRSTEFDWWRYLWKMYAFGTDTTAGNGDELTANEILDILVEADPGTWDQDGGGSYTDDPWPRWDAAAYTLAGDYWDVHLAQLGPVNH